MSSKKCSINEENKILLTIINKTSDIYDYKEDSISKPICKYGLRCFNNKCNLYHGIDADGRKILIKKFNKEWKTMQSKKKIREEIERNIVYYD